MMLSKIYEDMTNNKFFIIGNGGSGTSLLRGLLNAHSKIDCCFEKISLKKSFKENNETWRELRSKSDSIWWGNKVPFEQFMTGRWNDDDIKKIAEHFNIVWIVRRFTRYSHNSAGHRLETYKRSWDRAQKLYFEIKDEFPRTAIMISFEDLILRPESELRRICSFLDIDYEAGMMSGTMHTGFSKYNQGKINLEKI